MKRIFVRYVSHEIRTPLNTAFLGLQLLKSEAMEQLSIDTIDDIKLSIDIAVNMLNDLLVYEKLEGNIMQLHCNNIRIQELIADTIRPFTLQVARELFI